MHEELMPKPGIDELKLHILKKLYGQRCWMGKHFSINNLPQGLPSHARNSTIIKKAVDELIKSQWLLSKPTHYGLELSLNIHRKKEIEEYIEKHLS